MAHPRGKGTIGKALSQILFRAVPFHIKQCARNAVNSSFWRFGFRKHSAVVRKNMGFWMWWSLNRDFDGNECPNLQWWYYELEVYVWCWRRKRDPETNEWKESWGVNNLIFRNFRKFPLIRTALEGKANIDGALQPIFLNQNEAHNAPQAIEDPGKA